MNRVHQLQSSFPQKDQAGIQNQEKTSFNTQNKQTVTEFNLSSNKVISNVNKHIQNSYHKSDLEKLLQIPINQRGNVILKKIRNQLKQMNCFKTSFDQQQLLRKDSIQIIKRDNHILINVIAMYAESNYVKKGTILQATSNHRDTIKILIRGNIGVFQPLGNKSLKYCHQKYLKHQMKFEELNLMTNQINENKKHLQTNISNTDNTSENIENLFFSEEPNHINRERKIQQILKFRHNNKFHQTKGDTLIQGILSMGLNEQKFDKINFKQFKSIILQEKNINQKQAFKLLTWSNINSNITPHKFTKTLQKWGQFIGSSKNPKMTNQKERHQASMVCLNDCAYLQIDFNIFKQILVLINNDQQKPYIRALLKKFEKMQYYQAKRYVKIGTMIDKKKMNKRESYKNAVKQIYGQVTNPQTQKQNNLQQNSQQSQNQSPKQIKSILKKKVTNIIFEQNQRVQNKIIKKQNEQKQKAKKQKQNQEQYLQKINQQQGQIQAGNFQDQQIANEQVEREQIHTEQGLNKKNKDFLLQDSTNTSYEIQFQNQYYFIVEGEVTLIIDRISAYKVSQTVNANLKKSFMPKSLLKLYSGDMFGFEEIGKNKQFNLRYQVKMNSKILKMSSKIMENHFKSIQYFQTQINLIRDQRNSLLKSITQKLQNSIEQNLMKKYIFREGFKTSIQKQHALSNKQEILKNFKYNTITRVTKNSKISEINKGNTLKQEQQNYINFNVINNATKKTINKQFEQINDIFKEKKTQIRQIQYIGAKQFGKLEQSLKSKIQKQTMVKNHRKITLDLLKEFNVGIDFIQQVSEKSGLPSLRKFVQMRDQNGILLRKKSVPLIGSKKEIQNIVMKKIGILNQQQIVKHNLHFVKNRKSQYVFQDPKKEKKKQLRRLSKISKSLPKLNNFYAKSKNIVFNAVHAHMNFIY